MPLKSEKGRSCRDSPAAAGNSAAETGSQLPPPPGAQIPSEAGGLHPARPRLLAAVQAWYRSPRLNLWILAGLAAALALRKADALHTPQLWAEDGSVFLNDQQSLGLSALVTPYMGYLHTIPRLTVAFVNSLLDPAWWPACYNGVAFAIWLAVLARTFSPRLDLPHKPGLALAFLLVPHTGEILLNLTNVQWITAFALVQQAIIARPRTAAERGADLAIVALAGLTGPFVLALVPLFAARWWRDRHRDNLAVLLLAAAAAGVQGFLIHRAAITFEHQHAALRLLEAATVLTRRLLVWPFLGAKAAHDLPVLLQLAGGALCVGTITWRALRLGPQRPLRATLLAAGALLMLAGFLRMRPDTWSHDDLAFSDRYFFLPRVLLAWLILLELDATPRVIAWAARLAALTLVCVSLPGYRLPAPPDFHWADHCEPLRRGIPAQIPILPDGWTLHYSGRPADPSARADQRPGTPKPNGSQSKIEN